MNDAVATSYNRAFLQEVVIDDQELWAIGIGHGWQRGGDHTLVCLTREGQYVRDGLGIPAV
jgi:hypothetical protein